ncbi:MAG: phosphotransferase [Psychrobium sp.]|nr:phosphotransferase [Psychrobium sp.]
MQGNAAQQISSLAFFSQRDILHIAKMTTGLCNSNYRVDCQDGRYLVRFLAKTRAAGALTPLIEYQLQDTAFQCGLTQEPLILLTEHFDMDGAGIIVMVFCQGTALAELPEDQRCTPKNLALLAPMLSALHRQCPRGLTSLIVAKSTTVLNSHNVQAMLSGYQEHCHFEISTDQQAILSRVFRQLNDLTLTSVCLIHGDLNVGNLLLESFFDKKLGKSRLQLIDWEYGGSGDEYFDLASALIEFSCDKAMTDDFIAHYQRSRQDVDDNWQCDWHKLARVKLYYATLCWLWQPATVSLAPQVDYFEVMERLSLSLT